MDTSSSNTRSAIYNNLSSDFQYMLTLYSAYQHEVTNAKTSVKKAYYIKKINKIKPKLLQCAEYLQVLEEKHRGTASEVNV